MASRKCNICGHEFPASSEYFGHTPAGEFKGYCRSCERQRSKLFREANPQKGREATKKRTQRSIAAGGAGYTNADIELIRKSLGDRCAYCDAGLNGGGEIDHVIPVAREGKHQPDNLTLACKKCNQDKHAKTAQEFIQWRRFHDLPIRRDIDWEHDTRFIDRRVISSGGCTRLLADIDKSWQQTFELSSLSEVAVQAIVNRAIDKLDARKRSVIKATYGIGRIPISTQQLVAIDLGISPATVSHDIKESIRLLHSYLLLQKVSPPLKVEAKKQTSSISTRKVRHALRQASLDLPKSGNKSVTQKMLAHELGLHLDKLRSILGQLGIDTARESGFLTEEEVIRFRDWHLRYRCKKPDAVVPQKVHSHQQGVIQMRISGSSLDYVWPRSYDRTPFKHQIETTEFLIKYSRAFCLNDMGTAKTLSLLWAYDYLRRLGAVQKMLIVCPLSTMQCTWANEINRNFRGILRYKILHGDRRERLDALNEKADIYIINPDGLHKVDGMIEAFANRPDIDMVVVDEIAQCARNASTARFKALNTLINKQVPRWAYGLTGTPTPNSPTDAWAQCRLLVPNNVPPYFRRFEDSVMKQVSRFGRVPLPNAMDVVHAAMQPSIRFDRDQCIDLPQCITQTRVVDLGEKQKQLYREMLLRLHTEFDGKQIDAPNEMVKTMKLLQIASGAPYAIDGDAVFPPMPERLSVLEEIIDEASGKVIVFIPFRGAIEAVSKYLRSNKYAIEVVHGGVAAGKRNNIFKSFQDLPEPRILVAQAQAMSHGITLTEANTIVWFGPTTSSDTYAQANARISRPGQKRRQFIVCIEGTEVEKRIFQRLREKQKLQGILLDLLAEQFGTKATPKGHMPNGYEVFHDISC